MFSIIASAVALIAVAAAAYLYFELQKADSSQEASVMNSAPIPAENKAESEQAGSAYSQSSAAEIDPATAKEGDKVGDFVIVSLKRDQWGGVYISLSGETTVSGSLSNAENGHGINVNAQDAKKLPHLKGNPLSTWFSIRNLDTYKQLVAELGIALPKFGENSAPVTIRLANYTFAYAAKDGDGPIADIVSITSVR